MKLKHYILLTFAIAIESWFILQYASDKRDNENWIAPYLSAAANLSIGGEFMIDEAEVISFKELPVNQYYDYHFSKSEQLTYYNHNPIGFAYIIRLSTFIFPFLGDTYALLLLQVLVHIGLSILLLKTINNKIFSLLFILIYALNPIVINIVTLNFYYYWQCIPGFILLYCIAAKHLNKYTILILTILLLAATLARPTIILLSFGILILYFRYLPKAFAAVLSTTTIALFIFINKPMEKNIWHTIYVGLGAYPNEYATTMSDNYGYNLYEAKTGIKLNASVGGNYYETETIHEYKEITKATVIKIFKENPLIFIKAAMLNCLQCFSPGYINLGIQWLNILVAAIGCIFMVLLLKAKQYYIFLGIALYAGTFCLYYPPIQIYLFGAYVLLTFGFYNILTYFFPNKTIPIRIYRL